MVINLIRDRLKKTRDFLHQKLAQVLDRGSLLNPEIYSEVEAILIEADLGVGITDGILLAIQDEKNRRSEEDVYSIVRRELLDILKENSVRQLNKEAEGPTVILVLGVNGAGKTTAIAKLGYKLKNEGHKVLFAAADTRRAGAIEQLQIWADRLNVDVITHRYGADPAAVAFDAVDAAQKRRMDFLIIDTAGRFHTKNDLVEELKKIDRTINKRYPGAPHEKLIVIDANCGRNALAQAREFHTALSLTGIIATKLDGTAKAGALVGIQKELGIPVKFVGVGQELTDLLEFNPEDYVNAII